MQSPPLSTTITAFTGQQITIDAHPSVPFNFGGCQFLPNNHTQMTLTIPFTPTPYVVTRIETQPPINYTFTLTSCINKIMIYITSI